MDHSYSIETLNPSPSAASTSISQSFYSMPPNYFTGQSPQPRSALPNMAEPVRPVLPTGQTGVTVASPATPTPFASIHCSAAPSRMKELANFDSSYTTVACSVPSIFPRGSGVHHGPILDDVHNDLLRRAPVGSVQTISQIDPITHRLTSNAQASTSNCESHQSNTHVDCESDNSDDERKGVCVAELVWPSEAIPYSCS